jgi:putative transcriptional regulator
MTPVRIRLKEIRESKGLTQVDVAERAGLRRATVSDIENGKTTRIDLETMEKLANALGVDAALLIEHTQRP